MPPVIYPFNICLNTGETILGVNVDLFKPEYKLCEESAANMSCSKKTGQYGKGTRNTKEDPLKVERTGRLGEKAFEKLTGLPADFSYREFGDKYDFYVDEDCKIDVKTSMNGQNECGFIFAIDEKGRKKELTSDVFVFSYMSKDDIENKLATVVFVGYLKKDDLEKIPITKSYYGNFYNYKIPYKDLKPIKPLIEAIRTRFD